MSFVTSRVATFYYEIETWSGLGKSGAGETDGNGAKTQLTVLTSLPGNLPGTSRTAAFLIVGFCLPVSLPGNFPDLPGLRPFFGGGPLLSPRRAQFERCPDHNTTARKYSTC